ncbi:transcriptional regulator [Rhodopseudomonas pseudopalustris]|uniref:Uncharacterized protein n=1 Tax=Rhodopseudomonas pseudopalustris TaxID=1513892 RepID=A0A1H8Q4D8_9BRAD|nr:transcriptional regulator [Rhodopseudomonas pseudopalustris]SEO48888.1 hypothetical protein SAMN05444123_10345 [Rhodopseudomonas pseudopalustris]
MVEKSVVERSPASLDRARKKQLASEEGARTMAQFQTEAVNVRKNMERLRALRLAKQAQAESDAQTAAENAPPRPRKNRARRPDRAKATRFQTSWS